MSNVVGVATATVSEKGQITIPHRLRTRLNIQPGDVLEMTEDHGVLVASKQRRRHPLDDVYGILDLGQSVDDFVEDLRGPVG
jgi:AbrB family looped-hinge helix DNA binding protein